MPRSNPAARAAIALIALAGAALAVSVGASGCGPEPAPSTDAGPDAHAGCTKPFIGDASKPLEIEIIALKADYTAAPVSAGDGVALLFPPQGGRVVFAGVRARNVDPCGAQLTGSVRDLATQQISVDSRTINLQATDDGWGQSAES